MSNRLPNARPGHLGITDRLSDQMGLLARVAVTAEKTDGVFILGDLFDQSRVDAITLTATVGAISAFTKPVRIVAGNHDAVSTKGGRFTVEAFGLMGNENVKYIKFGRNFIPEPWLKFWPLEYCGQETARAALAKIRSRLDPSVQNILLLHHSILGCTHIGWTCDDGLTPEEATEEFKATFSGHFHTHQKFGVGGCGMYLGAPLHLRVEDEGRLAGYWIVSFHKDGSIERDFIDGGCPRFHTISWPWKGDKELSGIVKNDYIRFEFQATQTEWQAGKEALLAMVERLNGAGYRASFKHKPVYHHTVRSVGTVAGAAAFSSAAASPEVAADAYVDSADVDTTGLDIKYLKRIGRAALENARSLEK